MASDNKELPQFGEMQKLEKITLNFVQSHQTVFATHAPDIKNMHVNLHKCLSKNVSVTDRKRIVERPHQLTLTLQKYSQCRTHLLVLQPR